MRLNWIKQNISCGWHADWACQKIDQIISSYESKVVEIPEAYPLNEFVKTVEEGLKQQSERKKIIDDKARSALGTITIGITAVSFTIKDFQFVFSEKLNVAAVVCLFMSVYFFLSASIRAIQSLYIRAYMSNEVSFELQDEKFQVNPLPDLQSRASQLFKNKITNDLIVQKSSNYAFASFSLIRNGIICFSLFFVLAVMAKSNILSILCH